MIAPLFLALAPLAWPQEPAQPELLGPGSPAPALDVRDWPAGPAVERIEEGRVHVIDFWATWCQPCCESLPHLTSLAREYGDEVRVLAITVWQDQPEDVVAFLEKNELGFPVARDRVPPELTPVHGAMSETWMTRAGLEGIPATFVVGRDGRIAWIGNPTQVEPVLKSVLAGTFDVAAERERYGKERAHKAQVLSHLRRIDLGRRQGDWKGVLASCDEVLRRQPDYMPRVAGFRFQALTRLGSYDAAYAYMKELVEGDAWAHSAVLNHLAWVVVDPEAPRLPRRDLELALRAARRASDLKHGEDPAILDTLALVHFERGEVDCAVTIQRCAVKLACGTSLEKDLRGRLELFESAGRND